MDIEIIREFVEFSKTLSFSRTARAINISLSAFSSHILKLEKDLNAKLVDRGQSNALTAEGKLFLEYATSIVGSYDDAKSKFKQLHSGNQNVVRVHKAIFLAKPCDYFNRELYAFSESHPDIAVQLVADDLKTTTLTSALLPLTVSIWSKAEKNSITNISPLYEKSWRFGRLLTAFS